MGRIIYCLTIHMFALTGEYKLDDKTLKKVRDFNLFHVVNYVEPWFTANDPIGAPLTDLMLLHKILDYAEWDVNISKVARDAFENHLWYLSPHCVPLTLFDNRVSAETKRAMVANLSKETKTDQRPPLRFTVPKKSKPSFFRKLNLPQFVNQHSMLFFTAFEMHTSFLDKDPLEWDKDPGFQANVQKLKNIQVVNDTAERGGALCKSFNGKLTKSEDDFQNLLLVQKKVKAEEQQNSLRLSYFCPKIKEED